MCGGHCLVTAVPLLATVALGVSKINHDHRHPLSANMKSNTTKIKVKKKSEVIGGSQANIVFIETGQISPPPPLLSLSYQVLFLLFLSFYFFFHVFVYIFFSLSSSFVHFLYSSHSLIPSLPLSHPLFYKYKNKTTKNAKKITKKNK